MYEGWGSERVCVKRVSEWIECVTRVGEWIVTKINETIGCVCC